MVLPQHSLRIAPNGGMTTEHTAEVLYRTVLERWRRCHCEGGVAIAELRDAENELLRRRRAAAHASIGRLLRVRRASALQTAMRTWEVATAWVAEEIARRHATAQIRIERASLMEVEAQLVLAQEAEKAIQAQWAEDRLAWQKRQEEEMALVASFQGISTAQSTDTPLPPRPQPPQPSQPPLPPPPPPLLRERNSRPRSSDEAAPLQTPLGLPPREPPPSRTQATRRAFGSRADELLAAWRRESSVSLSQPHSIGFQP